MNIKLGQEISFTFMEKKGKGIILFIGEIGVIVELTADILSFKKGCKHFTVYYDEITEE